MKKRAFFEPVIIWVPFESTERLETQALDSGLKWRSSPTTVARHWHLPSPQARNRPATMSDTCACTLNRIHKSMTLVRGTRMLRPLPFRSTKLCQTQQRELPGFDFSVGSRLLGRSVPLDRQCRYANAFPRTPSQVSRFKVCSGLAVCTCCIPGAPVLGLGRCCFPKSGASGGSEAHGACANVIP